MATVVVPKSQPLSPILMMLFIAVIFILVFSQCGPGEKVPVGTLLDPESTATAAPTATVTSTVEPTTTALITLGPIVTRDTRPTLTFTPFPTSTVTATPSPTATPARPLVLPRAGG